ncbi:uncharacterized protein G2W53_007188 [Senna tora]|uniref:Uncharacterized protein n=1 Tax=Senna tora TaxID=362788 RepID=A0A835CDC2_9FABA|nr:uncharacterized protein G2W53_007188 [Senna tora]
MMNGGYEDENEGNNSDNDVEPILTIEAWMLEGFRTPLSRAISTPRKIAIASSNTGLLGKFLGSTYAAMQAPELSRSSPPITPPPLLHVPASAFNLLQEGSGLAQETSSELITGDPFSIPTSENSSQATAARNHMRDKSCRCSNVSQSHRRHGNHREHVDVANPSRARSVDGYKLNTN